jgi:hypothetical protein
MKTHNKLHLLVLSVQHFKYLVSTAATALLNMNVCCGRAFSKWDEKKIINIMEQCCPVHPLKINN